MTQPSPFAHAWIEGAILPTGIALATCDLCETLRATNVRDATSVHFFRRRAEEDERVQSTEPPCLPPPSRSQFRAPW